MKTYFIEIYNAKSDTYRSYHITADSKQAAVDRAIKDQLATALRYQLTVTEARAD